MNTFVVRLWLPDRPGALGSVASRIGAVRGDVVGIDILERGAGRAIDELTVELPDANLISLLVAEISQVDGVDVEDVRPATTRGGHAAVEALETAARLVMLSTVDEVFAALVIHAGASIDADWAAAVDLESALLVASVGAPPPPSWLAAFVAGSTSCQAIASGGCGPDDVAWALMNDGSMAIVMGRRGRPFRDRERSVVVALTTIAEFRRRDLVAYRRELTIPA
ncbi:MAG: hypothetical protein ACRDRT_06370 [Pseudonocardiaceae bacterium]